MTTHTSKATNGAHNHSALIDDLIARIGTVLLGKTDKIKNLVSAFLASGHILIEDVPGVGKTTLVRALGQSLGLNLSRIQFTADLLPTDITGVQAWDSDTKSFNFRNGPIFSELVLADEINRASPKTQSALLEAMAEKQISIDDMTMPLPDFFTVIATQNPTEHHGTYPLPESQLDRFMIRIDLGYMSENLEKELLVSAQKPLQRIEATQSPLDRDTLSALRTATIGVHLDETIADYLLRLVVDTRKHPDLALGCSTRGAMDFAMMARAHAFVSGRDYVLIDDVKLVAPLVLSHRLVLAQPRMDASDRVRCLEIVEALLRQIPVPR